MVQTVSEALREKEKILNAGHSRKNVHHLISLSLDIADAVEPIADEILECDRLKSRLYMFENLALDGDLDKLPPEQRKVELMLRQAERSSKIEKLKEAIAEIEPIINDFYDSNFVG